MEVALGFDIGTGSTKAGLVDDQGRLLAVARSATRRAEPRRGWSETDPADWLAAAAEASRSVLCSVEGARVAAIGFSGQMHGVVVCGPGLEPLRPAVLWSDRRAEPDLDRLRARLGPELQAGLANPVVAGMAGPSLAALRRLEPELIGRTETVLQPKDWLRGRLTGAVATDPSDASATLLWDIEADAWSAEAGEVFGVDPGWLPPVVDSGQATGHLSADGAALLGLAPGIPTATGAADTAAALLGAGLGVGETQLSTGTGGQLARLLDRAQLDPTGRTHLFRSAAAGAEPGWYAMAAIQNAGIAIDWAMGVLAAEATEIEAAMSSGQTSGSGTGAVTFLPYLTGERTPHLDASLTGRWVGLRPGTGRPELIRSVFEGVALALRDGLDALRTAGHTIDQALLAGGGSLAPWWRQLLADALQLPLVPHDAADASVRGAGLLGWAAIGRAVEPAAAVNRAEPIEPCPDRVAALALARERFLAAGPRSG